MNIIMFLRVGLLITKIIYDRYDRKKSKVYLGEYAAHLPGRPNNLETALSEALYLTAVERNGDVVAMASYAPLLAKDRHTQWNPDLIYFNNQEVKPTVGYYVQQMYGQNAGSEYIASSVTLDNAQDAVKKRIGVSVVLSRRKDRKYDRETGESAAGSGECASGAPLFGRNEHHCRKDGFGRKTDKTNRFVLYPVQ